MLSFYICRIFLVIWFSSVQSLSDAQLFATPWTAALQVSLSITNSQSLLNLISIESVMPSNHLILWRCLLLSPSIFPSTSGSFPMSQFFSSGGQSIGVSASTSVLSINIQELIILLLYNIMLCLLWHSWLKSILSNISVATSAIFGLPFWNIFFHPFRLWKWKGKLFSRVWLFATPWTIQFMEFSRPEYWNG